MVERMHPLAASAAASPDCAAVQLAACAAGDAADHSRRCGGSRRGRADALRKRVVASTVRDPCRCCGSDRTNSCCWTSDDGRSRRSRARSTCRIAITACRCPARAPAGRSTHSVRSTCMMRHFPSGCARAPCSARRRSCFGVLPRRIPHRGGAFVRALCLGLPGGGAARVPRLRPLVLGSATSTDIGGNHGLQGQGRADHRRRQRHRSCLGARLRERWRQGRRGGSRHRRRRGHRRHHPPAGRRRAVRRRRRDEIRRRAGLREGGARCLRHDRLLPQQCRHRGQRRADRRI